MAHFKLVNAYCMDYPFPFNVPPLSFLTWPISLRRWYILRLRLGRAAGVHAAAATGGHVSISSSTSTSTSTKVKPIQVHVDGQPPPPPEQQQQSPRLKQRIAFEKDSQLKMLAQVLHAHYCNSDTLCCCCR
jgi:hypothetical protein